jgi:3-phosphoshikimate 1-carboxyvinyltransferase
LVTFHPGRLHGSIGVPGDKSISHRALIVGARCNAPLRIANLNPGRDVRATHDALDALGIRIERLGDETVVHPGSLRSPAHTLDCTNSGSTARMLLGACAGAGISAHLDGDGSLRRRPMEPVAAQLRAFGAKIETTGGRLPLELRGRPAVETRHFILLAPSAQVKSALLFAGLFADVSVQIEGDRGSRDHTERLLSYLGAEIEWDGRRVSLGGGTLTGQRIAVAGDFSAAAFFATAAAITPKSAVVIADAGVNPTRTGLLDALAAMGAAIDLRNRRSVAGEPVADVAVEHRSLTAVSIGSELALRAIDELPLLAVAAAFASGTTTIAGIESLRTKESDRVAAIERLLASVGIRVTSEPRSLTIVGGTPRPNGAIVATDDDHRIVMAAAILACAAGPITVDRDASIAVSFPDFARSLARLQAV